jgi:DnaJ-domain-containing protein 1
MAKRPFISKGIDELEKLFNASGTELLTLNALENELVHRTMPRAVSLLKSVRKNLSLPQFEGRAANPNLFEPEPPTSAVTDGAPPTRKEPPQKTPAEAPQLPRPLPERNRIVLPPRLVPRGEPIPFPAPAEPNAQTNTTTMSSEEACAVLRITLGADWEAIEKSRREIVQKSHPDKLRSLPQERRTALIEHARQANKAIQVLLNFRTQQNAPAGPLRDSAEASPTCSSRPELWKSDGIAESLIWPSAAG